MHQCFFIEHHLWVKLLHIATTLSKEEEKTSYYNNNFVFPNKFHHILWNIRPIRYQRYELRPKGCSTYNFHNIKQCQPIVQSIIYNYSVQGLMHMTILKLHTTSVPNFINNLSILHQMLCYRAILP